MSYYEKYCIKDENLPLINIAIVEIGGRRQQ